jgi:hypothetical protein
MFNINTLNFMYHSDASISLSSWFSFTNIWIFDNIVGSFWDKLFWAIVWPLNSFYWFIKILFPFGFDDKQYCLFWKVFTIQQHKLFIDSPEYQTFTFIDYLIIFAVFLLLISWISLVWFPSYLSESEREERFNELGKNKVLKQKRKSNTRLNKVLKKK